MALTGDWNLLGDVFFRKFELYSMQWANQIDLQQHVIVAAPYGGPIAITRDEQKARLMGLTSKPTIYLFTSSGKEIASIRWNSGVILKLGWSNKEDLLCVQEDGNVLVYDIFGIFKRTFTMGQEARDVHVIQAQIFNTSSGTTGIAVLTTSYRIFLVQNIDDPRIRRLAEIPGPEMPPIWCVINYNQPPQVLVAKESNLYLLDSTGQCETQTVKMNSPVMAYIEMAVSFNNKYLALYTSNGFLWIGSSDLQNVYCEFDAKECSRPRQLVWCSTGAVVCHWENHLLMVGPKKDWLKFFYDNPVHLVPELDGLRIIGNESHEFLQKVPTAVEEIFKIGSMAPGSLLYEASREYQAGSQKADEYIRTIKDRLEVAVKQCVEAAGHEFQPSNQKALLRAASFGKCFLSEQKSEYFVKMCQELRVLNAVRAYSVGIPLTYMQLEHLKMLVLIDRLLLRKLYWLAIQICKYLKMSDAEGASRVLAHWACDKVQHPNIEDEQLACTIAQKLGDTPGVSYSEIANKAIECGKTELAIKLLNFEPKAAEQVPLLMKMKKDELALKKAIGSGDTDLVYMVLLQLKERMSPGDFLMAIRIMPVAHSLYLQHCREQNRKMLLDMYYQEDQHQEEANCRVADSYDEERLEDRLRDLCAAQEAYTKAKNETAAKLTEEQVRLLKYQRQFEADLNQPYLNKSLHDTLRDLITVGNPKVEQIRKEFKVPERRFWWLKMLTLAEIGDWNELDRFSKSKKSPIGYEPFVEVCVKYNNIAEAQKYVNRVAPENLVKCHIKIGNFDQAADIAIQTKNDDDLNLVLSKCGGSHRTIADRINNAKSQLGSKR